MFTISNIPYLGLNDYSLIVVTAVTLTSIGVCIEFSLYRVYFYADKDCYYNCFCDQNNLHDCLVGGIIHFNIQILSIKFLKDISVVNAYIKKFILKYQSVVLVNINGCNFIYHKTKMTIKPTNIFLTFFVYVPLNCE